VIKILIVGIWLILFSMTLNAQDLQCPHCQGFIKTELRIHDGWFPETWNCNKCGYDNYDGINYCGLCGEPRW
jgi:hypothetical protein